MSSIAQFQQNQENNNSAGGGGGANANMSQQGNFQQNQQQGGNSLAIIANQQAQQAQQQAKEINAITLCRLGQETVQEVISRMQELFQTLKAAQPPDGKFTHSPTGIDRKPKFQETLRSIKATFKRLRLICEKLEEAFPSERVVNFEADILRKSEMDSPTTPDDKKNSEAYKLAVEEYRDIVEQVMLRNHALKETIDHLRVIMWDCNTMLSMRFG